MRILLVGDTTGADGRLYELLTARKMQVEMAGTVAEAVRTLLGGSFDLLFLDNHLPGLDREAALTILREVAPRLPIVLVTRDNRTAQEFRSSRAGAFAVLTHPILPGSLQTILQQASAGVPGGCKRPGT
ncbi:MAG: response regulator [Candidatus Methylomirabilales bacterium]